MLALRLARGAPPLVLIRRLLVMGSAAGVGFLLLSTLGYAASHPRHSGDALVRLLWCLAPLAATVQLAASSTRTDTGKRSLSALDAAGVGPGRLPMLAAFTTAVPCVLGSAAALLAFLHLRGGPDSVPFDGAAADVLSAHRPLPVGAVLLLLCIAPFAAASASAFTLRPRPARRVRGARRGDASAGSAGDREPAVPAPLRFACDDRQVPTPSGLPWGAALTAIGITVATLSRGSSEDSQRSELLPLPGTLEGSPPGVLGGWLLTALGLVLAGPGLTHLCGQLISAGRPGALRLLSGRALQEEAGSVGRPLGVLCAIGSGTLAAVEAYGAAPDDGTRVFGPLTAIGAALILCCATASALTAVAEARAARAPATTILLRLGAPRSLLRRAAALRGAVLVTVLVALTCLVGEVAALPLSRSAG
ncbi:hypothetical protein LHJ74_30575 [Streptomyces sp. N2-109]|uniref:Integral membrane protein n=1 Tax=Streptomyces gossypii TaxID=2883101 RepID=A0ABT2K220_9ACTN|nr:hypothetical protein [Streptomyces gossypii]MCT2594203.1 hypothetical protein [Streptomyces gossypii]